MVIFEAIATITEKLESVHLCQNYDASACFIYAVIDCGSVLELLWKVLKTSMLSKNSSCINNLIMRCL